MESCPIIPAPEPIRKYLEDPEINDILINSTHSVFIEKAGKLERADLGFKSEQEVRDMAASIARAIGRELDPERPMVDARLADGSRVNIIAPPLAVDGTTISIRKFGRTDFTLETLVACGSMSPPMAEFLRIVGKCRINMIISGGTGSGKTTLLNAISQHISDNERVVTIEDVAELRLQKEHVVRLETGQVGPDRPAPVTTRDLVRNALRMRPDRIIVGEVRGDEAYDMMQAMNTGHDGSLTTLHSNHPRDALSRLENMILMSGINMPVRALRGQIASAVQLIIQVARMRDGIRRVTHISEVVGTEGDVITMQDLMQYTYSGEQPDGRLAGEWRWMGIVPRFLPRIAYWGEQESFARTFGIPLLKK